MRWFPEKKGRMHNGLSSAQTSDPAETNDATNASDKWSENHSPERAGTRGTARIWTARAFAAMSGRTIPSRRTRSGLTLVEMALATAVTAVFTLYVTLFISGGLQAQLEADRLAVASSLAQTKMSQLLSTPTLEQTGAKPEPHRFDQNAGIYAGYEVTVAVSQDSINLQNTLSSGEVQSVPVDDKLPAGVQNQEEKIESAGSADQFNALGDINVFRIVIDIKVPLGPRAFEMYRVETLRSAEKPPEMGSP